MEHQIINKKYKMICEKCKGKLQEVFKLVEDKDDYIIVAGTCSKCMVVYVKDMIKIDKKLKCKLNKKTRICSCGYDANDHAGHYTP